MEEENGKKIGKLTNCDKRVGGYGELKEREELWWMNKKKIEGRKEKKRRRGKERMKVGRERMKVGRERKKWVKV